jgi:hypothetical protein
LLASAGSALAAPSWLAAANLSKSGFSAFGPEVGIDAGGETVASWFGAEGGTGELAQVSTRPRGGTWSPAATLSEDGAINPDLAVSTGGTVVVVWEFDSLSEGSYIEAAVRSGGAWSTTILPKGAMLHGAYFPRAGVNAAGDALAVWQQCYTVDNTACFEGKGKYVVRAAVRPAGGSWSASETLSSETENAMKLSPAIDAAGDLAVAWEDMTGKKAHVSLLRKGAGTWVGHALAASPSGSPRVAFAADGTAITVWDEEEGGFWVSGSVAAPGSSSWSATQHISKNGVNAFQPDLAVAPDGEAVATWETLTGGRPIQAAVRSGGSWQPAQDLSAEGVSAELPRVAINAAGAAVAVWQASGGSGSLVQASARPAGGVWAGARDVSPSGAGATEPSVAIDPEGNGVAVWRVSTGQFAQAAGFDAAGPRLDSVAIPAAGVVGQSLGFSAAPSDAWSGVATTSWSFGDGTGASGTGVAHTFSQPGAYQVTVTSTDLLGSASSATGTVVVSGAPAGPATPIEPPPSASTKKPKPKSGTASVAGVAAVRNGKALLAIHCGGAGACSGVARLVSHGAMIGKATFQIPSGRLQTLRITLSPRAKQELSDVRGQRLIVGLEGRGVKPRKLVLVL